MHLIFDFVNKHDFYMWFIVVTTILYLILTKKYDYWASKNVKYIRPLPFFGNSFPSLFSTAPIHKIQLDQYNYFKGERYGGIWSFWKPKLLIIDPELVKHILIKDFSYFTDHDDNADVKTDPLTRNVVNEKGKDWKAIRSKLNPVFTSGKLKTMVQQVIECSDGCLQLIRQQAATGGPLEVRDLMAGFGIDVIASCAYGLKLSAINDPDSVLRKVGRSLFNPTKWGKMRFVLSPSFSSIIKLLGWRRVPENLADFFVNMMQNAMKHRVENNISRSDFIQLMMEVRKEEEKQLKDGTISKIVMSDAAILANAFILFFAGFETTANTLGYALYELSTNPHVQEKAYKEVEDVLKKYNGEITWEGIAEMKYTDMVINETLRKHPPIVDVIRRSVKPYKIPNSDLELPTGSVIVIPIYALQHDPEHYPDPEKFEPERFSDDNKHTLTKCTFLSFGEGPRICLGMKFARMEMKIILARILKEYKLVLNSKTITPLQHSKPALVLLPVGGLWVDFIPRMKQAM